MEDNYPNIKEKNDENNNSNLKIKKSLNPNFQKNKILINDYIFKEDKYYYFYSNALAETTYEVYNLKSNKKEFYLAYPSKEDKIEIIKYNYSNLKEEKLFKLENIKEVHRIKYFYQPNSKKEYLFILTKKSIKVYLISNEKEYKLINELKKEGKTGGYSLRMDFLPISYLGILYNEYNQTNILIVSFVYSRGCGSTKKDIILYEFDENEFTIISSYEHYLSKEIQLHLIYKDKIVKKYYLITYIENALKLIEIKGNKEKEKDNNDLSKDIQFLHTWTEDLCCYKPFLVKYKLEYGCIASESDKEDYLYLCDNSGNLFIISLDSRLYYTEKILKGNSYIISMTNYNEKYLIFGLKDSFLIYDINCSKIISKYIFKIEPKNF